MVGRLVGKKGRFGEVDGSADLGLRGYSFDFALPPLRKLRDCSSPPPTQAWALCEPRLRPVNRSSAEVKWARGRVGPGRHERQCEVFHHLCLVF